MSDKATPNDHSQRAMTRARQLRKARGWSAERLAKELASIGMPVKRQTIANQENSGRRDMTVDELYAFAAVFGVKPDDLASLDCNVCNGEPPGGFICSTCGASRESG